MRDKPCSCGSPGFLILLDHSSRFIIDSVAIEPRKDSYSLGPTLPAEMLKPPFRPNVAGRIAFFFSPIAGALVSVSSLRRMGYPVKGEDASSFGLS